MSIATMMLANARKKPTQSTLPGVTPPTGAAPAEQGVDPNLAMLMLTQPKFQVRRDLGGNIILPGKEEPRGLDAFYKMNPGSRPAEQPPTSQLSGPVEPQGRADNMRAFYQNAWAKRGLTTGSLAPQMPALRAPDTNAGTPDMSAQDVEYNNDFRLGLRRMAEDDRFYGSDADKGAYFAGKQLPSTMMQPPAFRETPDSLKLKALYAKRYNPDSIRALIKSGY